MNKYRLFLSFFIALLIVGVASAQNISTNGWNPNTKLLDSGAKPHGSLAKSAGDTLARDVKRFYQLLRDKKWHETYMFRAKAFREDISESQYLAIAIKNEKTWGLVNYEVLSAKLQSSINSTNLDTAVLICKFTELPGSEDSYATVYWHMEEGGWKCLSAGPSKLDIFDGTRPPIIDWR